MNVRPGYDDKASIITEVRSRPVLWDMNNAKYNDRFLMAVAWKEIALKLRKPESTLRTRWKTLRDTFKREMEKYSQSTNEYKGQWKYFQRLAFLKENYLADAVIKEEEKSSDDGYPIEFIVENDFDDEYDSSSENNARKKIQRIDKDVMFLRSLGPYFNQLDPLRKLNMRNKIQDLLMKEISDQNALN